MIFKKFEDMDIWREGRSLVKDVYDQTSSAPFSKDRGLREQVQRAVVSICSNIAEGYSRRGNKEFVKFLWIAKGSAAEAQSQLYHALDVGYLDESDFKVLYDRLTNLQIKIFRLIQTLSEKIERQKL